MAEKNRRLIQGEDIIYPFTKQENVIGLQKTIADKLPIISESQPSSGYVTRQAWIQPADSEENESETEVTRVSTPLYRLEVANSNEEIQVGAVLETVNPQLEGSEQPQLEDDDGNASSEIELEQN